jgi:twitching motility protein PilT
MMVIIYNNTAVKTLELILLYTAEEHKTIGVAMAESLAAIFTPKLCRTIEIKPAVHHDILLNTETIKDYIIQGKHDKIAELINEKRMI